MPALIELAPGVLCRPEDAEKMMKGNPGSSMSGITGKTSRLMIGDEYGNYKDVGELTSFSMSAGYGTIDDPHGVVAPSSGFKINGPSMQKSRVSNTVFDHVGPQRGTIKPHELRDQMMQKLPASSPQHKTKKMSGIKGLR